MFCSNCGTQLPDGAAFCPACGSAVDNTPPDPEANPGGWWKQPQDQTAGPGAQGAYGAWSQSGPQSGYNPPPQYGPYSSGQRPPAASIRRERLVAIILCCVGFVGVGGLHRFYTGKVGTGMLWLLTGGCFLVGTVLDLIHLIDGSFLDYYGHTLV